MMAEILDRLLQPRHVVGVIRLGKHHELQWNTNVFWPRHPDIVLTARKFAACVWRTPVVILADQDQAWRGHRPLNPKAAWIKRCRGGEPVLGRPFYGTIF